MASASHAALCRLLLRRSDRHPIACIDAGDLASFDPRIVREFVRAGLLVEREKLTDAGDVVFQSVGDRTVGVSVDDDGETIVVPEKALQQFDLDFLRLCEAVRKDNRLEGRIQAIDARVVCLGGLGKGSRRREFYGVRALQARNATDIALAVKGRAGGPIVILTPTERLLPNDVIRRLAADQITIAAMSEILKEDAEEPFALALPQTKFAAASISGDERLVIDAQGARATFDGQEVELRPREFGVLTLLAIELTGQNGFVSRDRISETIREMTKNDPNEEQIDKSINLIRAALANAARLDAGQKRAKIIETKRKVGYRLVLPPEQVRVF
jgi:DNA-binding winged helix-turn-helix (wHTH) protein